MAMTPFNDPGSNEHAEQVRKMLGPHHIDQTIRSAIQMCWLMLPPDKQTLGNVEGQIRRIVDRALENMREDEGHFGFSNDPA